MMTRVGFSSPANAREPRPRRSGAATDAGPFRSEILDDLQKKEAGHAMRKSSTQEVGSPSELVDARIEDLGDWRGETLSRVRALIKRAEPDVVEEWKWRKASSPGVPVWSHQGPICTGETYKSVVKLTFFKGASLEDPSGLFNASLDGNTRRAIDFREGDEVDEQAFVDLIRSAVSLNKS
jgi:hypothetical protein